MESAKDKLKKEQDKLAIPVSTEKKEDAVQNSEAKTDETRAKKEPAYLYTFGSLDMLKDSSGHASI